jgi:hypothetical protein
VKNDPQSDKELGMFRLLGSRHQDSQSLNNEENDENAPESRKSYGMMTS